MVMVSLKRVRTMNTAAPRAAGFVADDNADNEEEVIKTSRRFRFTDNDPNELGTAETASISGISDEAQFRDAIASARAHALPAAHNGGGPDLMMVLNIRLYCNGCCMCVSAKVRRSDCH